jgi:hypothetical protein
MKVEGLDGSDTVDFTKATVEVGEKETDILRPVTIAPGVPPLQGGGTLFTIKGEVAGSAAGIYLRKPVDP